MFHETITVVKLIEKNGGVEKLYRVEDRWAPALSDRMEGLEDSIKVDLSDYPEKKRLSAITRLQNSGIVVRGEPTKFVGDKAVEWGCDKTYYWSFATAAAKSGSAICVAKKGVGFELFPNPLSTIRTAAYMTPTPGGIVDVACNIRIATPEEAVFVGDGCFGFDPDIEGIDRLWQRPIQNKDGQIVRWESAAMQIRGYLKAYNTQFKGVGVPIKGLGGIVAHKGCFKSDTNKLPASFNAEFPLGVVRFAEAVKMVIGYQVTQNWPKHIWDIIKSHTATIMEANYSLSKDPLTFAGSFDSKLRTRNGRVDMHGLFTFAAKFCDKYKNIDLLGSPYFVKELEEAMAQKNTEACVSGGVESIGLMAVCNNALADNVIVVNPRDHVVPNGKMDEEYLLDHPDEHGHHMILGRYPSEDITCQIAVTVFEDPNQPEGTFAMNGRTGNPAGFDFDGDYGWLILAAATPWTEALWWHLFDNPAPTEDNGRQYGSAPSSHAAMMVQIMGVNIGEIANVLRDLQILRILRPDLIDSIEMWERKMKIELRKGVDSAKKAAVPNKELVKECRDWCSENGVTNEDRRLSIVSNGAVLGWREQPTDYITETFEMPKGTYVAPWEILSDRTYIGEMYHTMGRNLQQVRFERKMKGPHFLPWLPVLEGEGADFAAKELELALGALSRAAIATDPDEARTELFREWQAMWLSKLDMPEEWKQQAVSALWHGTFKSERGRQTLLWMSLPETIFSMLDENGPNLTPESETVSGLILGASFKDLFSEADQEILAAGNGLDIEVEVGRRVDAKNFTRQAIKFNGAWHFTNERTAEMPVGSYVIEVRATNGAGRWAFVSYGMTKARALQEAAFDAMLAMA